MTASSYRFVVSGRVQGVGFRESTRRKAEQLRLNGWVMNRPDGAVEGLVCGTTEALSSFRNWLSAGPPTARVSEISWDAADEASQPGFIIRR